MRPRSFIPRCLPIDDWPVSYQRLWLRSLDEEGLFGAVSIVSGWRSSSLIKTLKGFGVWVSWILQRVLAPDWTCLAHLVTQTHVRAYVDDLSSFCAPYTVFCRVQELYDAVRVMEPERDWSWLLVAVNRLRARAKPTREKLHRLRPAEVIEELGFDLMRRSDSERAHSPFKRALMFRDGLAIAFLIHRPLRLKNFASIGIGTHLVGQDLCNLAFPASEMKSKRPFEAAFPPNLLPSLHRYIQIYRLYLLSRALPGWAIEPSVRDVPVSALWISREGRAVDPGSFSKSITRRTRAAFGADLTPHLFRDASVTTLVRDAPASALLTKTLLGHSSIDTTNNHYNQAQMVESSRRYTEALNKLMQRSGGPS